MTENVNTNELRALYEAATPGEWWVLSEPFTIRGMGDDGRMHSETTTDANVLIGEQEDRVCCCHDGECNPAANAAFIAAAHNAMPDLLAAAEERDRLLEILKHPPKYGYTCWPASPEAMAKGVHVSALGLANCPWCNSECRLMDDSDIAVCVKNPNHKVEWLPWGG